MKTVSKGRQSGKLRTKNRSLVILIKAIWLGGYGQSSFLDSVILQRWLWMRSNEKNAYKVPLM